MKTLCKITAMLVLMSAVFMACQKEVSFEQGSKVNSIGSLATDASGNCLGAVISGTYYKDTAIKTSNYVDVSVKVDTVGSYTIATDTVNGYYFKATGTFSTIGTQTVRLVGGGKPLAVGTNIFTVTYNGTVCDFSITVTAPSGSGGGNAAFTINCSGTIPAGTYTAGTAMGTSNTVTLNVTVTTAGTWNVTTAPAVNGMTFSGTGTFATTGALTIVLNGSGTPTAGGTFTFTVTGGTGTCSFTCTVGTVPTVSDYFPRTTYSNWSYDVDTDSLLVKVIQQTQSALGNTYNIFMFTDDAAAGFDTLGYYRKAGSDYFEWGDLSWGILDAPNRGEYIFLKDNQSAGYTWSSPQFTGAYTPTGGTTFNATLRWDLTIMQQNTTVTVNGTSYPNTIVVKQEFKQVAGTTAQTIFYMNNYYAKDKGLIKQDLFDPTGAPVYVQNVRRLVIY